MQTFNGKTGHNCGYINVDDFVKWNFSENERSGIPLRISQQRKRKNLHVLYR